ncbi:alpha/beta fold hydrolase [Rhodococcus xishaensis]|uniref:Alpha/beta hydrolase n=1 Tax=Rhodococcus xishaensis TaxID=2487364 RepID=A0A438AYQ6_9NOCA|nr:alpha/beta hydrolase [Rhodococcus xishaensis]RVW03846.1 alpha/beta hydrolase [Rhodococcus xishaensis]
MESTSVAVGSGTVTVRIGGPESRHAVLLLPDAGDPVDVFDAVCARLHDSDLRTVAVENIYGLDEASVIALLDKLKLPWVNLVGAGAGAELAWRLAAKTFGRFASLIVADRGHPAVPDVEGAVLDAVCPAVELPTTVVVGNALGRPSAEASGRYAYSEFRIVQLDGIENVPAKAAAELASEIVLRTGSW